MTEATYDLIRSQGRRDEGWRGNLGRSLRMRINRLQGDAALVSRARMGDEEAFDTLAERYREELHALAVAHRRQDAAPDDVREMVLAAFRDVDTFAEKVQPGTWLYTQGFRAVFLRVRESARAARPAPTPQAVEQALPAAGGVLGSTQS